MPHKKIASIILISLALLLALSGCGNTRGDNGGSSTAMPGDAITADREGNPITLPAQIERVVSVSPTITEILVDLGVADKLVAVDKYSAGIAGVPADLPAYDMMVPDAESLVALRADIILVSGMSKKGGDDPYKPVADAGTCVIYIPSSTSLQAIMDDVVFVGRFFGKGDEAQAIADDMQAQVESIAAIGSAVPDADRRTVYFEINPSPNLYSFGRGTFLNEMIELVGATNILSDQESWISVSEEAVVRAAPDVILTNWSEEADGVNDILGRNGWNSVPAVREGRVYRIDRDASSRSNHRVIAALWEIAQAIYPEYYTD